MAATPWRDDDPWRLSLAEVAVLACPACRGPLRFLGELRTGRLLRGQLSCERSGEAWPVEDGLPRLYRAPSRRPIDRLLRHFYRRMPRLGDRVARVALPLLQASRLSGTSAPQDELRGGYLPRIELASLSPRPSGEPVRILQVGIGIGENLPWLRRALPPTLSNVASEAVEIWGVDPGPGRLSICRRRLSEHTDSVVRLLLGDLAALPLAPASFDRVFLVGAIAALPEVAEVLAEMARVARPGTPIVAVDEQLDPDLYPQPAIRALVRLSSPRSRPPEELVAALPGGALDVLSEPLSRSFYSIRFRMPPPPVPPAAASASPAASPSASK